MVTAVHPPALAVVLGPSLNKALPESPGWRQSGRLIGGGSARSASAQRPC